MRISRSPRVRHILNFIIKNKPKTLYETREETGIPPASLHLAIKNLVKNNLIKLDLSKSEERGRNATIYVPTFKGLITFLSSYPLPKYPAGYRLQLQSEDKEEAIKKLEEQVKRELQTYKREVEKLKRIIEKNGEQLHYPLFQHCRSLKLSPRLIELFVKISQGVLRSHFRLGSYEQSLLTQKTEHEKNLLRVQKFSQFAEFKLIVNGKKTETPLDPTEFYREQLESVNLLLNAMYTKEDEILRESFFMRFLVFFRSKAPNQELYNYASTLLEKRKREFDFVKEQIEKGMAIFKP